ncbi:MAG: chromate transporter [Halanaerobiales bacterium]|nr:chromate transporter [Halanaerobiales bacterium]
MIIIELFITFFKIGFFTFGGGYAMLPLIQEEMLAHEWLTIEQFLDIVAVSQMTPGAIAINNATFVGYKIAGIWGILATTFGVISPSLIIIAIVATLMHKFSDHPYVEAAWQGIRPAVVGLIMVAVISLGREAINGINGVIIGAIALFLIAKVKLHPILVIIISGALGVVVGLV